MRTETPEGGVVVRVGGHFGAGCVVHLVDARGGKRTDARAASTNVGDGHRMTRQIPGLRLASETRERSVFRGSFRSQWSAACFVRGHRCVALV